MQNLRILRVTLKDRHMKIFKNAKTAICSFLLLFLIMDAGLRAQTAINDFKNKPTLRETLSHIGLIEAQSIAWHDNVERMKDARRRELRNNYSSATNQLTYDNQNQLVGTTLDVAQQMSMGVLSTFFQGTGIPYLPQSKLDYVAGTSGDLVDLLWLAARPGDRVTLSGRANIFEIQNQILTAHRKDQRDMRSLLLMTALGLASGQEILNPNMVTDPIGFLDRITNFQNVGD